MIRAVIDNKFADVAIAAGVDYLVTNDGHFNCLKNLPFPQVRVLNLADFLALFPD